MRRPKITDDNAPPTLTKGTVDQQVWFREDGTVRLKVDMEDAADRVLFRLNELRNLIEETK